MSVSQEATGDWAADDEKWRSPLLFDVSKVTMLGERPAPRRRTQLAVPFHGVFPVPAIGDNATGDR